MFFEWQIQVCNPPIPNPEQPQYKRLKSYSMIEAKYKKNSRTKAKEEGSRTRIQAEEAKHLKGLPDGERALQLWLMSSLVVKSHWVRKEEEKESSKKSLNKNQCIVLVLFRGVFQKRILLSALLRVTQMKVFKSKACSLICFAWRITKLKPNY